VQARPLDALAAAVARPVFSVGKLLTESDTPPDSSSVVTMLGNAELLDDTDILFAPELNLDPLILLRELARRSPRIMAWPGQVSGRRATYSAPGRRDYYAREISDAIILRPVPYRFPDEAPYSVKRIT
jgi:hypothetical protein